MKFIDYLNESLDTVPYTLDLIKSDASNVIYEFTDEKSHTYKLWCYKNTKFGKDVWVALLSEKTPEAKAYKRIVSSFNNANKIFSTCAHIINKVISENHIDGFVLELPEKAYESKKSLIIKIAKTKFPGFSYVDVTFSDEELTKLGLKGVVLVSKSKIYSKVFKVGQDTTDYEDSKWPMFTAVNKIENLMIKNKFDEQRQQEVKRYIESKVTVTDISSKDQADKYTKAGQEVVNLIVKKDPIYRFTFKMESGEYEKRVTKIMSQHSSKVSKKVLDDIWYKAESNVIDSVGQHDALETDDKESWSIFDASVYELVKDYLENQEKS